MSGGVFFGMTTARLLQLFPFAKTFLRGSLGYGHWIFAVAFLIRLISLSRLTSSPFLLPSGSDMHFYDEWAKQILHGQWTDHRAFYGLPLYSYALALLYRLFGYSHFVPGLIQGFLDAGTALLIYRICTSIFAAARIANPGVDEGRNNYLATDTAFFAVAAAAAWTFFVPAQAYSIILMPTAASVFIFWFLIWRILRRTTEPSPWRSFGFGSAIGVAAMAVATSLTVIPIALVALFRKPTSAHRFPARRLLLAILLLVGVIVGSSPCWVHNLFVARDPVFLSAHGGINLWLGNNPEATGYPRFPGLHAGQSELLRDSIEIAESAAGRDLKRSEVSKYWSTKARSYIAANPLAWLRLLARKVTNFWNAFEYDDLGVIRNLRKHGIVFPGLHFGFVAVLGLAGLLFAWRPFPSSRWIAAALVVQMLAILSIFVTERYRLVVVPGLLILAAPGLSRLWENFKCGAYGIVTIQLAVVAASAAFVTIPRHDPALWALDAYNEGRLALELNDLPRAEQELQRAHDLVPDNAETNFALGNLRLTQRDLTAAKKFYDAALKADPKHKGALNNLGIVALDENSPAIAADYFRRSLVLQPQNAKTQYLLAKALLELGDRAGAEAALARALELAPNQPEFLTLRDLLRPAEP
jgi:tetratricopeptide (TPR) repeat protein